MEDKIYFELEGNTDDLLMVNNDNTMKCTRLIHLGENLYEENQEVVDICITSTNMYGEHPFFDKLLGKKIKMSITVLD